MLGRISYYLSKLRKISRVPAIKKSIIHKKSKVCSGCLIVSCELGKYTYIGHDSTLINVKVGSFTSIANGVIIGGAAHPIYWVSTSPVFTEGKNVLGTNFSKHQFNPIEKTQVGSDVWIGNNALIKSGVRIGNGAIIGMGAVVTKTVPDYEIWAGNPAKFIRKRFDDSTITALLKSKWWEFSDSEIELISNSFSNVSDFIKYNEEKK